MFRALVSQTIILPDKREIILETGELATQADGAVVVKMGGTVLLATAVLKKSSDEKLDFLPLYVDYQEKFYAAGKIPGGFFKREGRLGDHEVLVTRLVDRILRPLFPTGFNHEVQVTISLISADENVMPDALAALAASAALVISPIPFQGPISEVRVVRVNGSFVINPVQSVLEEADTDLMVGANEFNILMVEGEMHEAQEGEVIDAIKFAHEAIQEHCRVQKELAKIIGKEKESYSNYNYHSDACEEDAMYCLQKEMYRPLYDAIYSVVKQKIPSKKQRKEALQNIKCDYFKKISKEHSCDIEVFDKCFDILEKEIVRDLVLNKKIRLDGRALSEVRPIHSKVDYLPSAHGSALFTRGETQSLTTVTLGSKLDEQLIDRALENGYSRFILHYNFPGFSTGEIKPNRGPSRREIGHGNLAIRALKNVLLQDENCNYTIRVVSDILESNGSSSMATVCAGSLALMDAGIPMKSHVAGIAMGLMLDIRTQQYAILSDILGEEDHLGDMDFKVAGTLEGITACQMDMKIAGISYEMLEKALKQAKEGRLHIYKNMCAIMPESRKEMKSHVPRISFMEIAKDMIGTLIGPSGKVIQALQKETDTIINVEEVGRVGIIRLFAANKTVLEYTEKRIKAITAKPVIGEVYTGTVKSILDFGAFIEFLPGKDGLLHISEVRWERIDTLDTILTVGEKIDVKLISVDHKSGKYKLSHKVLLANAHTTNINTLV